GAGAADRLLRDVAVGRFGLLAVHGADREVPGAGPERRNRGAGRGRVIDGLGLRERAGAIAEVHLVTRQVGQRAAVGVLGGLRPGHVGSAATPIAGQRVRGVGRDRRQRLAARGELGTAPATAGLAAAG